MAIQWGSYGTVNSPVRGRVGVDLSLSYPGGKLDTSDTTATVTGKVYFQTEAPYSGFGSNGRAEITGDHTQTTEGIDWNTSSGGSTLVLTFTDTVSLTYGSSQVYSVTARFRGVTSWNFTPSKTATITVPARPYSVPAAPTSLTATRVSDTRQNLAWERNATTAGAYQQQEIIRSKNGGAQSVIATISGSLSSYSDLTTEADAIYIYWVRAKNSAGSATSSFTTISTTPKAPSSAPTAAKDTAGNIVVTRPALSSVATHWEAYDAATHALVGTRRTAAQAAVTHPTPNPAQAWSYYVKAISSGPTLLSAASPTSVAIQIIAPPLAPTGITPLVADATEAILVGFQHNAVDSTPLTKFQMRWRLVGAPSWTTEAVTTTNTPALLFPPGTWANGDDVELQVMSWGAHADPSPWSASAIITMSARPVVGILSPGSPWTSQVLDVQWSFFDPEGGAQAAWLVILRAADGEEIERRSGTGQATSLRMNAQVDNGQTYQLEVTALDGDGIWANPSTLTFPVEYANPPVPLLDASWRLDDGYTVLTVTAPPEGPTEQPTESIRVERLDPSGGWVLIADDLASGSTVVDMIPPLGQAVSYRATSTSPIGSLAHSALETVRTDTEWVFINHGGGFGGVARLWGNLGGDRSYTPDKVLQHHAGADYPTVLAGRHKEQTYNLTGTVFGPWIADPDPTSAWEDFVEATDATLVCLRLPDGVKLFGTLTSLSLSDALEMHQQITLPFTVTGTYRETVS